MLADVGLHQSLVNHVYTAEELPETWEEYQKKVVAIDGNLRRLQAARQAKGNFVPPVGGGNRGGGSSGNWRSGGSGSGSTEKTQEKKLSPGVPMDIDRARREGRCFNCGGRGHLSRDCKKPWQPHLREVAVEEEPSAEAESSQKGEKKKEKELTSADLRRMLKQVLKKEKEMGGTTAAESSDSDF
jgi:hypothetical protein